MTYFLIAGEASGDLHASQWIHQTRLLEPDAVFVGFGGERMAAAGCRLIKHYREMAYMGVVAVVKNAGKVLSNFRLAKQSLLETRPDVLVLVDYPSFNLRIAAFAKRHLPETKIYYYIPPKVWAHKTWRIHRIARLCDRILCIFPFEPAFYARYGYKAEYVGNPTAKEIAAFCQQKGYENIGRDVVLRRLTTQADPSSNSVVETSFYGVSQQNGYKHVYDRSQQNVVETSFYGVSQQNGDKHVYGVSQRSGDKHVYDRSERGGDKNCELCIVNRELKIALLPGSREHEIRHCLPRMLAAAAQFPEYGIKIAKAPSVSEDFYMQVIRKAIDQYHLTHASLLLAQTPCNDGCETPYNDVSTSSLLTTGTYALLASASAAIVNSGTATLEAALLGCPEVAVYHVAFSHLLQALRPLLFRTRFFTLPNIILGRQVITELLGHEFTVETTAAELRRLLYNPNHRQQMLDSFDLLRRQLMEK